MSAKSVHQLKDVIRILRKKCPPKQECRNVLEGGRKGEEEARVLQNGCHKELSMSRLGELKDKKRTHSYLRGKTGRKDYLWTAGGRTQDPVRTSSGSVKPLQKVTRRIAISLLAYTKGVKGGTC